VDHKIQLLKQRMQRRLVKLAKWVDIPECDRLPPPVYRQVPSTMLPKGVPRAAALTRGIQEHLLVDRQTQDSHGTPVASERDLHLHALTRPDYAPAPAVAAVTAATAAAVLIKPDLAATLQNRIRLGETVAPTLPASSSSSSFPAPQSPAPGPRDEDAQSPWAGDLCMGPGMRPLRVTIVRGRVVDPVTGERSTTCDQELCECGTAYTIPNKSRHMRSLKHTEYLQQLRRMRALSR
jgi:hypothetical protein